MVYGTHDLAFEILQHLDDVPPHWIDGWALLDAIRRRKQDQNIQAMDINPAVTFLINKCAVYENPSKEIIEPWDFGEIKINRNGKYWRKNPNELFMVDKAPYYKRPFEKLEELYPLPPLNIQNEFLNHYQDFKYVFRTLELIEHRLKKEIKIFKEVISEIEKTISRKDKIEVGKKLSWIDELIQLDIESFYLFARILYDKIPYILMPFEYLVIKKGIIPKRDSFNKYLTWIKENSRIVLDQNYITLLNKLKVTFKNIKDPRDMIIVHQKNRSFIHGINKEGIVIRQEIKDITKFDKDIDIHQLNNVTSLMHKMLDDFDVLENYYIEKLR